MTIVSFPAYPRGRAYIVIESIRAVAEAEDGATITIGGHNSTDTFTTLTAEKVVKVLGVVVAKMNSKVTSRVDWGRAEDFIDGV